MAFNYLEDSFDIAYYSSTTLRLYFYSFLGIQFVEDENFAHSLVLTSITNYSLHPHIIQPPVHPYNHIHLHSLPSLILIIKLCHNFDYNRFHYLH